MYQSKFDGGDEKVSVIKLYLLVPIKELYDDMINPPSLCGLAEVVYSDRNLIISDSNLCELFPPQVKLMWKKRIYLCGSDNLF